MALTELHVQDVDLRVAKRFGKNALRFRRDRASDAFVIADVHEDRIDTNPAKGDIELINSSAVQGRRNDELIRRRRP